MSRDFNGTTDRIDWANIFNTAGQPLTISAWMNADVVTPAASGYLFNGSAASNGAGTVFFQRAASQSIAFTRVTDATLKDRFSNVNVFTAATWTHVLVTDDGSLTAANAHIYVNGTEVGYATTTNGTGTELTATGLWSLGGRLSDDLRNFDGKLAEMGVWNRELNSGEIAALAKGWCPLFFFNSLRFYAPLFGSGSNEPNYLGATATTLDGTLKDLHVQNVGLIYPQRSLFVAEDAAVAAGQPAMRRFGGVRFARDIPVGVRGVSTF